MRHGSFPRLALLGLGVVLLLPGCAHREGPPATVAGTPADPAYDELFDDHLEPEVEDPFEDFNRRVFRMNRNVDRFVIDPISRAYSFAVPDVARRAIRRVFVNLNSPAVFVNDLLQLAPRRASVTGARFLINSTLGLAGLLDTAERMGLAGHQTDFGITLAKYGVDSGPYLVLPIVGPTTARDAFGDLVDILMLPQTWFLGPTTWVFVAYQGGDGFTLLDLHRDALDALEESAVDFYVAMRFAYLSNRAAEIRTLNDPGTLAAAEASEWPAEPAAAEPGGAPSSATDGAPAPAKLGVAP